MTGMVVEGAAGQGPIFLVRLDVAPEDRERVSRALAGARKRGHATPAEAVAVHAILGMPMWAQEYAA